MRDRILKRSGSGSSPPPPTPGKLAAVPLENKIFPRIPYGGTFLDHNQNNRSPILSAFIYNNCKSRLHYFVHSMQLM